MHENINKWYYIRSLHRTIRASFILVKIIRVLSNDDEFNYSKRKKSVIVNSNEPMNSYKEKKVLIKLIKNAFLFNFVGEFLYIFILYHNIKMLN